MKFLTALVISTTAALALSTAAVSSTATTTSETTSVVNGLGDIIHPNDNAPPPGSGGKPTAAQHRAQKSHRMAERRARVKAAIANLPNEPDSHLQRMSAEDLEKAYGAAEESARVRGLKRDGMVNNNPGGGFIRKAKQELEVNEDLGRKLWGNSNVDPYEPLGGLAEETNYYVVTGLPFPGRVH